MSTTQPQAVTVSSIEDEVQRVFIVLNQPFAMEDENVVIECRDCDLHTSFANLSRARVALSDHELALGHDVDWQINRVEAGVERAGSDAGVCGISGCENSETPLLGWSNPDEES